MPLYGMEEESEPLPESEAPPEVLRCTHCDSVVPAGSPRCIMCGKALVGSRPDAKVSGAPKTAAEKPERRPSFFLSAERVVRGPGRSKRRSAAALWILIASVAVVTAVLSVIMLRSQGSAVILALQPTFTPIPLAPSLTPTWTPVATATPLATPTPVPSETPLPTDTPRPPRFHSVASGESIFGLSLFYRVSAGSIAEANGLPLDSQVQVGQELNIPWPTATPPLESMVLEIGGEQVVADVTNCDIVTIQEGDSAYGLSAQRGVPAEAIVAVNRLTEESIQLLHPGDTLCIPRIIQGNSLPPTVGPEPTSSATAYPAGPTLLYPVNGAEIDSPDGLLRLQWVAVKDLEPDEWYMVEVTDLEQLDSLPYRAFTRDTSLKVPSDWRAKHKELHEMQWRVSIVRVAGERVDGAFIYEYGGQSSEAGYFHWLGAEPTPTPTATPTETPLPE